MAKLTHPSQVLIFNVVLRFLGPTCFPRIWEELSDSYDPRNVCAK